MRITEPKTERGFSLVELIVVMVVLGILAGFTAMFITKPVVAYLAAQRRAELVDIADTALLRIARDVRLALPNSVRVVSASGTVVGSCSGNEACYLEYLPVVAGGRYRATQDGNVTAPACPFPDDTSTTPIAGCDILDFRDLATNDASFEILGPALTVANTQFLVVYNTGNAGTLFDAWTGGNRRDITSNGTFPSLQFTAQDLPLPGGSEAHRFFVTDRPVSYVCDPAAHTIRRYWGYIPSGNQPVDLSAAPGSALLASRVSACAFSYSPGSSQRLGQLTLSIQLENTDGGDSEQIALYREVAVNNEP